MCRPKSGLFSVFREADIIYLHLGGDVVVRRQEVVGVFDMDTSTWSKHTKSFLTACEKSGRVINVSDGLPRSAIVCHSGGETEVYISQLSPQTLLKRFKNPL